MRFVWSFGTALAAVVCSPALAKTPAETSWGKAGVPLERYAQDAAECSDTSRYVTTYVKPETLARLDALSSAQLLDTVMQIGLPAGGDSIGIVNAITKLRSADDVARRTNTFGEKYVTLVSLDVKDQLQAVIDRCLIERGYVRIRLTGPQVRALHSLKLHSRQRTAYLHSIDSDPTVVAQQRIISGK